MSARRAIGTALRRSSSRRSLPWMEKLDRLVAAHRVEQADVGDGDAGHRRQPLAQRTDIWSTLSRRCLRSTRRTKICTWLRPSTWPVLMVATVYCTSGARG